MPNSQYQVAQRVLDAINEVLKAKGTEPATLSLSTEIDDSLGMDSLDWAEVVIRLEDALGVDPFQSGDASSSSISTIGDLVRLYTAGAAAT